MNNRPQTRHPMHSITSIFLTVAVCFVAATPNPSLAQSNSIESITSAQQGSSTVLRIGMSRASELMT